ncbi:MAG: hypothetical protein OXF51_03365, partial [Alphaproteobacteria bacterium]|nr:hypothetical protein [Alphaproteobacteria bacterium]
ARAGIAAAVRLVPPRGYSERGDVFAGLCGVRLYDLMDGAYDATEIHTVSQRLGHIPIIVTNPRRDRALKDDLNREARAAQRARQQNAPQTPRGPYPMLSLLPSLAGSTEPITAAAITQAGNSARGFYS